jgi:hypothetical protein
MYIYIINTYIYIYIDIINCIHRTVVVTAELAVQGGVKMESFEPAGVPRDHRGVWWPWNKHLSS